MLQEYKTKTNIGILIGLAIQVVGVLIMVSNMPGGIGAAPSAGTPNSLYHLGYALRFVGLVPFVWGCWNYMMGKGYHGAFGLLGLLSLLGLIVLVCFPDKYKNGDARVQRRGFEPQMRPPIRR